MKEWEDNMRKAMTPDGVITEGGILNEDTKSWKDNFRSAWTPTGLKLANGIMPSGEFVGYVTNSGTFPTTRLDGTPLQDEDYVYPLRTSTFPFQIVYAGIPVTFTNFKDCAVWTGTYWQLKAGAIQDTQETPIRSASDESITGTALTQKDINSENKTAINAAAKSGVFERTSDDKLHLNIKDRNNNNIIEEKRSDVVFRTVTEDNGAISTIDNQKGQHGSVLQSEFGDTIVSVNTADENGEDGIVAQVYAKTKSTNQGARLNVKKTGMYYGKGTSATTDPSEELATLGDVSLPDDITVEKNASGKLQVKDSGITKAKIDPAADVVFKDDAQTLTAKTIDADDNTITDLTGSNLKAQTATEKGKTYVVQSDGSWALGKAGSDVDNTTIDLNASEKLEVKDKGITLGKISDDNIGTSILEDPVPTRLATNQAVYQFAKTDGETLEHEATEGIRVKDGGLTRSKFNSAAISQDISTDASTCSHDKLPTERATREAIDKTAIQTNSMPFATPDKIGKIYQFIGETTSQFTNGYFYKCVEDTSIPEHPIYEWVQLDVQPSGSSVTLEQVLDLVYPIGSYHFGNSHPTLGTWEEIEGDKAVWIKKGTADGTNVNQSLPKPTISSTFTGSKVTSSNENNSHTHTRGTMEIKGCTGMYIGDSYKYTTGAFSNDNSASSMRISGASSTTSNGISLTASNNWTGKTSYQNTSHTHDITAEGTVASSVDTSGAYGSGTKVQPDALVMRVWKRTA